MRINTIERVAGTTLKVTWVNTGASPAPITSALLDRSELCVSSVSAISSGDGHYYAYHSLPTSYAGNSPTEFWLVNEWIGVLSANTYVSRQLVHVWKPEVG